MKNLLFLSVILIYFSFNLKGQEFEKEIKNALKTTPMLDFRLDSRNSFISSSNVRIFGIKLGLQYDNKISIGLGYNQLVSELNNNEIRLGDSLYSGRLNYNYLSPYIEYIFYQDKQWEFSIPVQFGVGNTFYSNNNENQPSELYRKTVISYEPAIIFQYRFLKYFGAGMGVGYRLMIIPNKNIEERFTSPVYLFKFKVYFQELYGDILD